MIANRLEKFEAYLAVQDSGAYNMLDPRARSLANEMSDYEITRQDWIWIIKNYSELMFEYDGEVMSECCSADIENLNDDIGICSECKDWCGPLEPEYTE
jgi:hypothetical protein